MSEEEAIEWAKVLLQDKEKYVKYHSWVGTNTFISIQKLLNLIDKRQKEIEEEKEKWKELFHEYNKLVGEVIDKEQDLKDSISKDKIRDKIKELENEVKQMEQADIGVGFTLGKEWENKKATIQAYKELLEEN